MARWQEGHARAHGSGQLPRLQRTDNADIGRSLLDEIVHDGARQMLAVALQAEVADYIGRHAGDVDDNGHRLVVRNGYHAEREVVTAAEAVTVKAPRSTTSVSTRHR